MQPRRSMPYGLAMAALAVLAILGWIRTTPASAQQEAPPPIPPGGPPRAGRPMMMMGPASIAAGGNYVYVLRGNTLYQYNASDLSPNKSISLPAPNGVASNDQPQEQASTLQCPVCKMQMTAVRTASNTQEVKIGGKTWYCCANCDMSSVADK